MKCPKVKYQYQHQKSLYVGLLYLQYVPAILPLDYNFSLAYLILVLFCVLCLCKH